jgi:glycosyltransferase involved in cell wall biosynthesis
MPPKLGYNSVMIIGIEAERANNPKKTGVEHYAKQLILHLADIDKQNQYRLYLRTKPEAWFLNLPNNFSVKVMPFPLFWTQIRISWEILFNSVDVLFIPASALPIIHSKNSVVTIHDLAWKFYPQSFTWFNRNFLEWSTRFAVKNASSIIAVSESTKRDLVKFYKVNEKKIRVVHHGWEGAQLTIYNLQLTAKQELPDKYILFLSTLQPRKNLEGLIEAFKQLKKENQELPQKLVVVGRTGWKFESILKRINENSGTVVYFNHVSDKDRFAILAKADLLVLPSFYEGFGMQLLESFACGVPVATSNISSMPEVAGEAAVYFDPHNIGEIKNAIKSVLLDRSLHDRLKEKGFERLKDFSWNKCAKETLQVLTT